MIELGFGRDVDGAPGAKGPVNPRRSKKHTLLLLPRELGLRGGGGLVGLISGSGTDSANSSSSMPTGYQSSCAASHCVHICGSPSWQTGSRISSSPPGWKPAAPSCPMVKKDRSD